MEKKLKKALADALRSYRKAYRLRLGKSAITVASAEVTRIRKMIKELDKQQ